MKKARLVLLVAFLLMTRLSFGQEKDRDVMIKKIFSVLAQKDEEGFVDLFPDAVTLKEFMMTTLNKDSAAKYDTELTDILSSMNDSAMQVDIRENFHKYIRIGESHGVDWAKAKLISFIADSSIIEEDGMKAPMLTGKIYFDIDAVNYFLAYSEVIWFENKGWYGVTIDRVDLKSRENEEVGYDWDGRGVDTTLMVMDSVVAVTTVADTNMTVIADKKPGAKPKNNKQPGKNKSTKPKSQTPIRKED